MQNIKLFELATRTKMRFPYKGSISVEDMWDLPIKELDLVFKSLNKAFKETEEESLIGGKTRYIQELQDKIDIIKYIVEVKQAENLVRLEAAEKAEKKQRLLSVLAKKQNETIENMSEEDILKELESL